MHPRPTFNGNCIAVGDRSWSVPYPIADARWIGDRVVVIYDYRSGPKHAAFHNVEAFDDEGRKLWTAENPGTSAADAYVEFVSEDPLIIGNFTCLLCTIDPLTGNLLNTVLTK